MTDTFICNFTGPSGSSTFIDLTGKTITAHGNAQIGTTGGQHGLFDGAGDYLTVPDSDDWTMSGEFTVELVLSMTTKTDNQAFCGQWDSGNAWYLWVVSGQLTMRMVSASSVYTDLVFTWTPTLGQTYHIAIDRDGLNKLRMYIDGAMVASATYAATMNPSNQPLVIGAIGQYGSFPAFDFQGKMYGVRLTKGAARYATDTTYTVPSLPFTLPPAPELPPALVSKGISLIIHTQPIRQIGTNTAFDLAQPRHNCDVITGPLRSTIGGENDNVTVSFAAGDQLQTAMLAANGARMVMYNDGVIEFDGTINSARFEPGFVQITGAA